MTRNCDVCRVPYEAKRASSKYCSDGCRKRAQRAPGVPLAAVVTSLASASLPAEDGSLCLATVRELEAADQLGSSLGQACLFIARRLDSGSMDTGSSVAALLRELRATIAEAIASGRVAADPLDQIAAKRAARQARA